MTDEQQHLFWKLVESLSEEGCLQHIMLIGSWAEYLYEQSNFGEVNYIANSKTYDLDFFIRNREKKFNPTLNIDQVLTKMNFKPEFSRDGYVRYDYIGMDGVLDRISSLNVEFLVVEKGVGQDTPIQLHEYGIIATSLRNLEILRDNPLDLEINGFTISTPCPAAYVLQKMIINMDRGEKKEKDQRAIENILAHYHKDTVFKADISRIFNGMKGKSPRKIRDYIQEHQLQIMIDL